MRHWDKGAQVHLRKPEAPIDKWRARPVGEGKESQLAENSKGAASFTRREVRINMDFLAPALSVRSITESLQFYQDVLGFQEWFRWNDASGRLAAGAVVRGNARIIFDWLGNLSEEQMKHLGTGVDLYVDIGDADIDDYYEQVKDKAQVLAPIADKPWGDRVFTVADPDGYRISFARTAKG